ncbi:MAG: Jag N-terminal domain-containing protein, partial [Clostridia bacterium]|nr:Jag N-terminal domain-containing protein [Clostridia bacterium]
MEFSGRTVDEAIFHGLNEMGVTIDQVDIITVQSESKGIFGFGARNAIVRLVERETPVVPDFTAINEERREQREERRERRDRKEDRREGRGRGDKRSDRRREEKEAPAPVEEIPYSKELAEELDSAKFLQELLNKMNVNGTVSAF